MTNQCKRCLLLESGQKSTSEEVNALIEQIDDECKVDSEGYSARLKLCKSCDFLISGMCRKCGCYVELRAIQKALHCPNADDIKW